MSDTPKTVLEFINTAIRAEKGNRVTPESKLVDSDLDSFGFTVIFLDLDTKYNYFKDVMAGTDPFSTIDFQSITIQEVIDKCLS